MIEQKENGKRKNDLILIGSLLLAISVLGSLFFLFGKTGDTVTVTVGKTVFGEYSLSENRVVEIRTERSLNVLVIENGRAYIRQASCPDGICSSHPPIFRDGESIICLPNQVIVTVSKKNEPEIDIVV